MTQPPQSKPNVPIYKRFDIKQFERSLLINVIYCIMDSKIQKYNFTNVTYLRAVLLTTIIREWILWKRKNNVHHPCALIDRKK